jgi:hypothetical protein
MSSEDIANLYSRVLELERKVDHVLRHATDIPPLPPRSSSLSPAVIERIEAGDVIGAIKTYKDENGVSLATAKAAVEAAIAAG